MSDAPSKENQADLSTRSAGALYVHVPLCPKKCRYCNFYSVPFDAKKARDFVEGVKMELAANSGTIAAPLNSVFFGGGTPTVLPAKLLEELLQAVRPYIDERTEFTVEANPGTIDDRLAEVLLAGGVNRVSLGVQSFDAGELQLLGRIHTPAEAVKAANILRAAGVGSLSLDLIYGIPGQTLDSWRSSLEEALGLGPEHLSCYGLSFEAGTELRADRDAGRLREMDESLQKRCWLLAIAAARQEGLEHYEISNFAQPGRRCRHNITYWKNAPYLGLGPGASRYLNGVRQTNRPDLQAYLDGVLTGKAPAATKERLTGRAAAAETLMLGLRMTEGVEMSGFLRRFGTDPRRLFPRSFRRYMKLDAIIVTESHVRLSSDTMFVSDTILAEILSEV